MSNVQVPETMTSVILESYNGADALRVVQRPVPKFGPNEVLIRVAASPINPSDQSFLLGHYGFQKPTPVVPGFEGSGTVIAVGGGTGLMGRYLMGKRVACVSQQKGDGIWAEYVATAVNYALPLDDAVSLEQGAMSVVNPLTAVALIDIAKSAGHKTIINTAAASVLGQMLHRLGQQEGVDVVGIVRRVAQLEQLKQQGVAHVLNSSDADFAEELRELCHQQNIHLAFDAIAGDFPLILLNAMPDHSKVTVYGGLSQQVVQIDPTGLIFQDKSVDGFWLTSWIGQKSFLQNLLTWRRAQKLMNTALKTEVRARYALSEVQKAAEAYENQMTGGKILLVMEK